MQVQMLKGKIHRATVTQAELDYVGSITIDRDLMDEAGILEYEKVLVADVETGGRLETYVIAGDRGSGVICLNGAAAHIANVGDKVIIMAFAMMTPEEASVARPLVVFVDEENKIARVTRYEHHGKIAEQMIAGE